MGQWGAGCTMRVLCRCLQSGVDVNAAEDCREPFPHRTTDSEAACLRCQQGEALPAPTSFRRGGSIQSCSAYPCTCRAASMHRTSKQHGAHCAMLCQSTGAPRNALLAHPQAGTCESPVVSNPPNSRLLPTSRVPEALVVAVNVMSAAGEGAAVSSLWAWS